ncbi:hypothetical protein FJM65_07125 [Pontibacter mangrovi]|uniref:Uncharacterized protein n=1 Tax=Pontibacter mangrovi TaxID=2589816 RepID=A0A501WGT6_9BACT|nr:hypothetical protein FJM65_07125 [Pontibacter mangrovi]
MRQQDKILRRESDEIRFRKIYTCSTKSEYLFFLVQVNLLRIIVNYKVIITIKKRKRWWSATSFPLRLKGRIYLGNNIGWGLLRLCIIRLATSHATQQQSCKKKYGRNFHELTQSWTYNSVCKFLNTLSLTSPPN